MTHFLREHRSMYADITMARQLQVVSRRSQVPFGSQNKEPSFLNRRQSPYPFSSFLQEENDHAIPTHAQSFGGKKKKKKDKAMRKTDHGLSRWWSGKESACQCRRCRWHGFDPWVRKIPWRRKWQRSPAFFPGESHGKRSLASCSPWSRKVSDTTEWLTLSFLLYFA